MESLTALRACLRLSVFIIIRQLRIQATMLLNRTNLDIYRDEGIRKIDEVEVILD